MPKHKPMQMHGLFLLKKRFFQMGGIEKIMCGRAARKITALLDASPFLLSLGMRPFSFATTWPNVSV
jgi:hypothetical protein